MHGWHACMDCIMMLCTRNRIAIVCIRNHIRIACARKDNAVVRCGVQSCCDYHVIPIANDYDAIHVCMPSMHAIPLRSFSQTITTWFLAHKITMPSMPAGHQCMQWHCDFLTQTITMRCLVQTIAMWFFCTQNRNAIHACIASMHAIAIWFLLRTIAMWFRVPTMTMRFLVHPIFQCHPFIQASHASNCIAIPCANN